MKLILIAALTRSRVIGRNGAVPWNLPEDIARFKRMTLGHSILMGRRTFESLRAPLAGRRNLVLTSGKLSGVETFPTIDGALREVESEEEVFVIGGGQIFAQLLSSAAELRLTIVDQEVDGDTFFPPYQHLIGPLFRSVSSEKHEGFTFVDYVRV